jgi:hypothetical protein
MYDSIYSLIVDLPVSIKYLRWTIVLKFSVYGI